VTGSDHAFVLGRGWSLKRFEDNEQLGAWDSPDREVRGRVLSAQLAQRLAKIAATPLDRLIDQHLIRGGMWRTADTLPWFSVSWSLPKDSNSLAWASTVVKITDKDSRLPTWSYVSLTVKGVPSDACRVTNERTRLSAS
jgi:hypothetical protein